MQDIVQFQTWLAGWTPEALLIITGLLTGCLIGVGIIVYRERSHNETSRTYESN